MSDDTFIMLLLTNFSYFIKVMCCIRDKEKRPKITPKRVLKQGLGMHYQRWRSLSPTSAPDSPIVFKCELQPPI